MPDSRPHRAGLGSNADNGRRVLHSARCFLLVLVAALTPLPSAALELAEVSRLAQAGAPRLALRLLDEAQTPPQVHIQGWMAWERERITLLAALGEWESIAVRLAELPPGLPPAFLSWAASQRARALLALERPAQAREELAALIWQPGAPPEPGQFALWRRLVIQSYLAEGRRDDAYAALLRYQQDYADGNAEGALLAARVLLSAGLPLEATAFLKRIDTPEAAALRALADLRAQRANPREVHAAAERLAKEEAIPPAVRQLALAVAAEAAGAARDTPARVIALEKLLGGWRAHPLPGGLFDLSPDSLWSAYLGYARVVGNAEQLLIGDDAAWFKAAEGTPPKYPIRIRSLYALMALEAARGDDRERAHARLVESLLGRGDGAEIVRQLYLASGRFAAAEAAPAAARRFLTDQAIQEGDLALASRLQAGLDEPPEGTDRLLWQLRRAKIFILGGQSAEGVRVLEEVARRAGELSPGDVDRLVQLLFDLQTVGAHQEAIRLFDLLARQVASEQLRREFLYWMGDSQQALGRHAEAGRLYLQSATLFDPLAMDPWAQTARYQAAQALAEAGLVEDARGLLEQLLGATQDPARQAVLRRDLQQLWLGKP